MKEIYEFRIPEDLATSLFKITEGSKVGTSIRKITLTCGDPRFQQIGILQKQMHNTSNRSFFYGWKVNRKYAKREFSLAQLYQIRINHVFEPAGEECGTVYEQCMGCQTCGSGFHQVSPLYLPENCIPKRNDFCRTIAGEVVVSRPVADLLCSRGLSAALKPIYSSPQSKSPIQNWFQLATLRNDLTICDPTRVGIDPFDDDVEGLYRCNCGQLLGLNLLSEVWVSKPSFDLDAVGILGSSQFIGIRRGLLRPERILFVSPGIWKIMMSEKLKGVDFEVVHVV